MPGDPVTLDLSQSQPVAGALAQPSQPSSGVKLDLSQSQPVNGSAAPAEKPGLVSTVGSDLAGMGKGLLDFASEYIQHGMTPYDPENPLIKVLSSQWDSSVQAKNRMMDAAKKGDALGVVQHAAGVVPVASQVDDAMTKYQAEPSHENLAHVITSALPAFVPSLMRGAGKLGEAASEFLPSKSAAGDMLGKVNDAIGSNPVVADEAADKALQILDKQSTGAKLGGLKKPLQQFIDRATDPKEPLTFKEAREFEQNFRSLTPAQKMNLGAGVRPLVNELHESLRESIQAAAEAGGQGDEFRTAMRSYKVAAQGEKAADALKGKIVQGITKGAATGLGVGAAGEAVKATVDAYRNK